MRCCITLHPCLSAPCRRAYLDSVVKLNTMYCKQWGFCDYKMIHNPSFHNSRLDMTGRSVAWQKVLLMHDYINTDKYDWVMWMDSDAAIIDQSVDLRWIIAKYAMSQYGGNDKVHMLVSSDIWCVHSLAALMSHSCITRKTYMLWCAGSSSGRGRGRG